MNMSTISVPRTFLSPAGLAYRQSLAAKGALCLCASLFVALCAHISVPLPFTPVPTTLQTFAVVLVGITLGPSAGFAALILYLAEGASGLPVFSPHGPGGVAQLLGPTAGYLFSYPLAAALAGASVKLLRRRIPAFPAALASGSITLVPVFFLGAVWLAHLMHLTGAQTLHLAVTPFLGAEVLKLLAAAAAYQALCVVREP